MDPVPDLAMQAIAIALSLAGAGAFGWKLIDLSKYVRVLIAPASDESRRQSINVLVTQGYAWLVGIGIAFLIGTANGFAGLTMPDGRLYADFDGLTKSYIGIAVISTGSVLYDRMKANDDTQTAATPPLVPPQS